jgi:hypothetical protein
MGEMVERVKAAIKLNIENAQIGKDGRVFDKYELAAKAAIEELRKQTRAMDSAGYDAYPDSVIKTGVDHLDIYRAMIDAALKE